MARKIRFKDGSREYTLEYCLDSIKRMEKAGFNAELVDSQPATMIPMLVSGAFRMHHDGADEETVDAIYRRLPDKSGLIRQLVEMYAAALNSLVDEPDGTQGKNLLWTVED